MTDWPFTRIVYPVRREDGTVRRGWIEQWLIVASHTGTARMGEEPASLPGCSGCNGVSHD